MITRQFRIQYLIISGPLKVCTPGIYGFLVINAHFYISNKGDNSLPAITIMLFCDQGRTTPKKVNILESLTIIVYLLHFYSHILQSPAVPSQPPSLTPFSHSPPIPQNPTTNPHFTLTLLCSHQLFTDLGCWSRMRVLAVRAVNWSRALPTIALGLTAHARTGPGWSWCRRYKYKDKCTYTTTNKTNTQLIRAPNHRIWIIWYK